MLEFIRFYSTRNTLRQNIILIDFENVQPESINALEDNCFKVIIFVGANQTKIPFEIAASIQRMGTNAEYVKILGNGKNALDFHIAFHIGQLTLQNPNAYFQIISKDSGFDPLIQYLKSKKILSARFSSIDDIPMIKTMKAKVPNDRVQLYIEKLKQPKVSKPRTSKTLFNSINSFFQKQLSEQEIQTIIKKMTEVKFISITDEKISYL